MLRNIFLKFVLLTSLLGEPSAAAPQDGDNLFWIDFKDATVRLGNIHTQGKFVHVLCVCFQTHKNIIGIRLFQLATRIVKSVYRNVFPEAVISDAEAC